MRINYKNLLNQNKNNYDEAYNQGFIYFLFNDKKQLNDPCLCKDYFQDYFWSCYTNNIVKTQYGFSCTPEEISDYYTLVIGFVNEKKMNCFSTYCVIPNFWIKNTNKFLVNLSNMLGLPAPLIKRKKAEFFSVIFHKQWTEKPALLSMLTSCIRLGCFIDSPSSFFLDNKKVKEIPNPYLSLISSIMDHYDKTVENIKYILENGIKNCPDWESFDTSGYVHNYSGIVCLNQ